MPIQELPIQVANQIAAGEVVERPASVVKELIENAIDAGATEIEIKIEEAGLRRLQITDNGTGMDAQDAALAFKRHATSKIFSSQDLFRIRTLGFRGEALPSIASVSEVTLETSDGETGTYIYLQAGEIIDCYPHHLRQGTSVTVENIFYNTPARLKYLKSMPTELAHITDIIHREAIGHPQISFKFINDGKSIFVTNGKGEIKEVLAAIYNYKDVRDMVEITGENLDFKLQGYITPPAITRSSKKHMSIYLNGRYIKNFIINKAIISGYGSKLMVGRFPIAVLNITLDPQLLDVNVHPTKQEVRISKEERLFDLIKHSIIDGLKPVHSIPDALADFAPPQATKAAQAEQVQLDFAGSVADYLESYTEAPAAAPVQPGGDFIIDEAGIALSSSENLAQPNGHQQEVWDTVAKVAKVDLQAARPKQHFPQLDYIGQMHGTYLLAANEKGMYMIDQHAAQERIKYEFFRATIADQGTALQDLLIPYIFDYTQAEVQQITQILPKLKEMGLELEVFGDKSFVLHQQPIWMGNKNIKQIVENMIELALVDVQASLAQYREAAAIMMSCKQSIKANQYLSAEQAKRLISDLAQSENPYNCPHGRPTLIHFSNFEIERMFKRIQDPH